MSRRPREYEPIWLAIKEKPAGESVVLRVHHSAVATLIQAVRKEKAMENGMRKKLDMPYDGRLQVVSKADPHDKNFSIVKFTLKWSYRDF